ncbi:hypothetical protein LOAG_05484, partial [Loa loa]
MLLCVPSTGCLIEERKNSLAFSCYLLETNRTHHHPNYTYTHTHTYIHTYTYAHTHTHTYTHTHIRTYTPYGDIFISFHSISFCSFDISYLDCNSPVFRLIVAVAANI